MFQFKDKVVYIISPELWGGMKVSKHNYALELAERNCKVIFIEPPQLNYSGISVKPCADHPQISIVKYRPIFRGKRFLPVFLYSCLVKLQVKRLKKVIGVKPDIVVSFHGYLFENLKWFGAEVTIFFAADMFIYSVLPPEVYSSDFSLAISDTIFEKIKKSGKPAYFINHGLQHAFADAARKLAASIRAFGNMGQLQAGYSGNLRMEAMDRGTMIRVISSFPDVNFFFWGSYKKGDLNLGGIENDECEEFIQFLEKSPNVVLRGVVSSEQLLKEMKEMDMFWICWRIGVNRMWDGSNSHKILEYLSTGRPVISHYVSTFRGTELLYMLPDKSNEEYVNLFCEVVRIIKVGENPSRSSSRLAFAIDNTYSKQIDRIGDIINGFR